MDACVIILFIYLLLSFQYFFGLSQAVKFYQHFASFNDFCDLDRKSYIGLWNLILNRVFFLFLFKLRKAMSRKYKFHEKSGAYFVSFATVYWVGVFVREIYFQVIVDALDYCRKHKGMILYAYCIMPTHIHLLFQAENQNPSDLIRDFKTFTAKILIQRIKDNLQENRREWLLWMFSRAAERRCNVKQYQFWQHHNQPIEIYSQKFFDEKLNYIHQNPVVSGFVSEPWEWKYN